jgi:hypothetical protein
MTAKATQMLNPLPAGNYSSAIAKAVEWLGDRYLLAKPIGARRRSFRNGAVDALDVPVDGHQLLMRQRQTRREFHDAGIVLERT